MSEYLFWSGVVLNIALLMFISLCFWVWFIWPFVEALSITRCFVCASKAYGGKPTAKEIIRSIKRWYLDLLFGRNWTRISNHQFEWEGVGKWRIHCNEED